MNVPKNLKNPMRSTWIKGYTARIEKKVLEDNPYELVNRFTALYYKNWKKGWEAANADANNSNKCG
jgi:hypothetical protein